MKKVLSAVMLLCLAWAVYVYLAPHGQSVEVLLDGKIIRRINLTREPDGRIEIRSQRGYNILEIKNGAVRVVEADCPNHDCIRMGVLRTASLPIVCLPHKMTVRFASGGTGLDSVSQ